MNKIILILLVPVLSWCQTIPQSKNICFFQDAKTHQSITIVDDSLVYKGELKKPAY